MTRAPVNKIIDSSFVDGPGNRTAIFLQGCNISCAYCHNPETQNVCPGCGLCVRSCPTGALTWTGDSVVWDADGCCGCDTCIGVCPNHASPKVTLMSPDEVMARVRANMPFIRGITVSGGECMLRPEWMELLFRQAKEAGLTALIDSNGTIDFSLYPGLMDVCDGVMLDVKSWDAAVFRSLTGGDNAVVRSNLAYLLDNDMLEELRVVCLAPGLPVSVDAEDVLRGAAAAAGDRKGDFLLKLIRFRPNGVRGILAGAPSPSAEYMDGLRRLAGQLGFTRVKLT